MLHSPWRVGEIPVEGGLAAMQHLQDRLQDLEETILSISESIDHGPVRGAYFPVVWHDAAAVATSNGRFSALVPFECVPILLALSLSAGEVTVDLEDDGVSILTAALTTVGSSGSLVLGSDFSLAGSGKIAKSSIITLDVDAIASSPTDMNALLVLKSIGKIGG